MLNIAILNNPPRYIQHKFHNMVFLPIRYQVQSFQAYSYNKHSYKQLLQN